MISTKSLIRLAVSAITLGVLLIAFQNCSPAKFGVMNGQSTAASESETDNGTGYGGKLYVSRRPSWNPCADGTFIAGRMLTINRTQAVMDRSNCDPVAPRTIDLTASDIVGFYSARAENPFDLYVYDEQIFEAAPPKPYVGNSFIMYACFGSERDAASGLNRITRVVMTENPDPNNLTNYTSTIMSRIGGVPQPGSENIIKDLSAQWDPATQRKTYSGSTAGYFQLLIDYTFYPRPGALSGSAVGFSQSSLTCVTNN